MNHQLWTEHLARRIRELEADIARMRRDRDRQRQRAEFWKHRALEAKRR